MARSFKKTPRTGIAKCASEKQDKRFANRKLRRKVNVLAKQDEACRDQFEDAGPELSCIKDNDWQDNSKRMHWLYPELREVSNVWSMGKDGKFHFRPADYPTLMRK